MKRIGFFTAVLLLLFLCATALCAAPASSEGTEYQSSGFSSEQALFDGSRTAYSYNSDTEGTVTLYRSDGIGHLYIEFDRIPQGWTLTCQDNGKSADCGKEGFLHEYINITELFGDNVTRLELSFPKDSYIADIYCFSKGELPSWVQTWQSPLEEADLLLLSSHSDDEQLFFAGILPYYAVERELKVQVAYIVQHFEVNGTWDHRRPHEQLDGLWTVGVRNYPVMSDFPDVYSESTDRAVAFSAAEKAFSAVGVSYDDFCSYITECIRRFKPLVVVSHDLDGEYGHGTHVFCAAALTESIGFAADEQSYPESADKYGLWQVEKTYLHLYPENKITMDWDTPYESLGGKTPFNVTQEGFGCHKSQHWCWFYNWLYGDNNEITKASQITYCSPCEFGLYDSRVGPDVKGGDFFENITVYAQRKAEAEQAESESVSESISESISESLGQSEEPAQQQQSKEEHSSSVDTAAPAAPKEMPLLMLVAVGVLTVAALVIIAITVVYKKH